MNNITDVWCDQITKKRTIRTTLNEYEYKNNLLSILYVNEKRSEQLLQQLYS